MAESEEDAKKILEGVFHLDTMANGDSVSIINIDNKRGYTLIGEFEE